MVILKGCKGNLEGCFIISRLPHCVPTNSIIPHPAPFFNVMIPSLRHSLLRRRYVTLHVSCRFLGLLDTVGALGVPSLDSGVAPAYEFYDQVVSWQVSV